MGRPPCPTEEQEMLTLAEYLDARGDLLWCHVPNERHAKPQYLHKLRRLGVKKGVPDVLILEPMRTIPGVAIELKRRRGGKESPEQRAWIQDLRDRGWVAYCCYGADQAINVVELCYGKPGTQHAHRP